MCEATFRSSTPRSYLNITYPVYVEVNGSIELKRKYGGDEDPEYSDLDRKLIAKMKQ